MDDGWQHPFAVQLWGGSGSEDAEPAEEVIEGNPEANMLLSASRSKTKKRGRGNWTREDDEILQQAVMKYNGRGWKEIAQFAFGHSHPRRSDVQCRQRWKSVLDAKLVKGRWTKEEDDRLVALVSNFEGEKIKWAEIAKGMPGRLGKQCRERWTSYLDPGVVTEPYTEEEEAEIIRLHQLHGTAWSKMRSYLPGRTDNSIKNQFHIIQNRNKALTTRHEKPQEKPHEPKHTEGEELTEPAPELEPVKPRAPSCSPTSVWWLSLAPEVRVHLQHAVASLGLQGQACETQLGLTGEQCRFIEAQLMDGFMNESNKENVAVKLENGTVRKPEMLCPPNMPHEALALLGVISQQHIQPVLQQLLSQPSLSSCASSSSSSSLPASLSSSSSSCSSLPPRSLAPALPSLPSLPPLSSSSFSFLAPPPPRREPLHALDKHPPLFKDTDNTQRTKPRSRRRTKSRVFSEEFSAPPSQPVTEDFLLTSLFSPARGRANHCDASLTPTMLFVPSAGSPLAPLPSTQDSDPFESSVCPLNLFPEPDTPQRRAPKNETKSVFRALATPPPSPLWPASPFPNLLSPFPSKWESPKKPLNEDEEDSARALLIMASPDKKRSPAGRRTRRSAASETPDLAEGLLWSPRGLSPPSFDPFSPNLR